MKSSYYLDLLRGRSQDIPNVRSKVVRVFVSSTFTDTLAERDSLIENIFPNLKDYARQKYGLEFQYVDMRWGIQTESQNNHGETATCLHEIELCKKYSVATNFVVLLSHRYGSRPIPAKIHAPLFEILKQTVISDEHNQNNESELLTQWYRLDTNCVPAAYILQDISSIIPNFISKNPDEVKKADKEWKKVSYQLRTILRKAAQTCLDQSLITQDDYDEFFISITEKEIINGILAAKDANERTLCFLREIVDIGDHLSDDKASKYIDITSTSPPIVDEEAKKLLDRLKNTRIPAILKSKNIFKYEVHWSSNGITRQEHRQYIEQFNNDFYEAMKEQIDQCVQSRLSIGSDSLQNEVLEHAIQCKTYVSKFHGRLEVLSKLEEYVNNKKEQGPCVVYGESGCGKTSLMAKAATEVFKWWSSRSVSVVLRFLGTTPSSSNIYKTLFSISTQISEIYNISIISYPTVEQLRDQLESNLLSQIPDNQYLLILLDSIDQLQTDGYDCKWLPKRLPSNVKFIVSTMYDRSQIYDNLQSVLNADNNKAHLFIDVPSFDAPTVEIVYNDWLRMKKRSLSDEQRLFIKNYMSKKKEILPLFMKLVFDVISIWHSYDAIDQHLNDLDTVDDFIRYLFHRLEIIHNKLLFSRALCYMTACRSGISQNELEDVLSLDDDVLRSVFQHYIPPVRRLPGILWTRIRNDLDEYITEKEVDDAPVIYWYHRRFIEVARKSYISNITDEERKTVFQNMVDFYRETWKGKDKPFKIDNQKLVEKYHLDQSNGEIQANRFTTSQPIEFIDVDGRIQYNKRKLNELPKFLSKLAIDMAIPIAIEEIIFNYSFMHAKYSCSSFFDINNELRDFQVPSSFPCADEIQNPQKELRMLQMTYIICGHLLNEYPDNYAFELTSRLLSLYGLKSNITNLIKQCDEQCPRHCAFIVPYNQITPPGNGLFYSMNKHTMPVVDMNFVNNQTASISLSNKIVVIAMMSGNTAIDLKLPVIDEPYLHSTTLASMIIPQTKEQFEKDDYISDSGDSRYGHAVDEEQFKRFLFFIHSVHHVYFISAHGNIKFHQTSSKGYSTVEIINRQSGLCLLVENQSKSFECWILGQNKLLSKIDLTTNACIKKVLCTRISLCLCSVILSDGTILFYVIGDNKFIHRGTIHAGKHLHDSIVDRDQLICTFDSTIPIDFVHIDLKPLLKTEKVLTDDDLTKTVIAFNPSIKTKPIERIVLPDDKEIQTDASMKIFFLAITKESLYVVHVCRRQNLSYASIPGQFDVVAANLDHRRYIYTARGGIINIFKWKCVQDNNDSSDDDCNIYHKYQLFVSIDISSSPILTIKPVRIRVGFFLCSMENGTICAYHSISARESFKKIPPFPRATQIIHTLQLSQTKAITLDKSKQELTTWLYQHSTAIQSRRQFTNSTTIEYYAVLDEKAILLVTNTCSIEVYAIKSLDEEPLFRLYLRQPTRVFTFDQTSFIILTNDGSIRLITQQTTSKTMKFNQTLQKQINIKCLRLLCSVITIQSKSSLVVLDDDLCSLTIWTPDNVQTLNINLTQSSTRLLQMTSDPHSNNILFYFENRFLTLCQLQISSPEKTSFQLISYKTVDRYSLKKNSLVTANNNQYQLNLHQIDSSSNDKVIELENECLELCLNENGDYVFVLIQPRVLFMYRMRDGRQLGKLFMYDYVTTMSADEDFIVLGMNDRRLLTLMIADPDDLNLQSKIQALPSRQTQRSTNSANKRLVEQIENTSNSNLSDEDESEIDDEDETNDNQLGVYEMKKTARVLTLYRYVHRLNGTLSLNKMKSDQSSRTYFLKNYAGMSNLSDTTEIVIDDSDIDDNEDIVTVPVTNEQEYNLDDIRQKVEEYDRQQIKGIQLANAGTNNIKIVNNYPVTSNTCTLL